MGSFLTRCNVYEQEGEVLLVEMVGSFVYYFTWIIVRNYNTDEKHNAWSSILKPFFVSIAFIGGQSFSGTLYGGYKSPLISLMMLMRDHIEYDYTFYTFDTSTFF